MRSRLFWKIFWNFWLTFLLQLGLMWLVFTFVVEPTDPAIARLVAERSAPRTLGLATRVIAMGGPATLGSVIDRDGLRVTRVASAASGGPSPTSAISKAPDGVYYRIDVILPKSGAASGVTPGIYLVGLVTGILSAASLAYYLARPIRLLKSGFDRFAAGGLDTRLAERIGRRRDEIADLARDFDGMAAKIEDLVSARDQLLDDVSHELRSPLARLQLAIALARQKPGRTEDALARIEREATRLDEMVSELLTLSRLESGAPLIEGYLDLAGLVERVVDDARFEGRERGVNIELSIEVVPPGASLEMPGDAELLRRAFENVLRNAVRYSSEGGSVRVRLRCDGTRADIVIEDDGPGAPPAQLPNLFDSFVKGVGGGWGLGLSIARRAVEAHDGTITATNTDTGLRVQTILPMQAGAN